MRRLFFVFALFFAASNSLFAQGTAFTYNGRLNAGGAPANGSYDLTFTLFPTSNNGISSTATETNTAVAVNNGLFVTTLDFGTGVFNGTSYWLEIGVRSNATGDFITLTPRQAITPAPYAIFASGLDLTQQPAISTVLSGDDLTVNVSNVGTGTFTSKRISLTNLVTSAAVTNALATLDTLNAAIAAATNLLQSMAYQSTNAPVFNNATNYGLMVLTTNAEFPGSFASGLWFNSTASSSIFWNQGHPGNGELQITSYGSMSLNVGYDDRAQSTLQIGSSGPYHEQINFQYDLAVDAATPMGYSKNVRWVTTYMNSDGQSFFHYTGLRSEARDTEGDVRLIFYNPSPEVSHGIGNNTVYAGGVEQAEMLTNGWNLRGRLVQELRLLDFGTNIALDFKAAAAALNLTITGSNVWFYTTNWPSGITNFEEKRFVIHSEFIVPHLFFPTNWTWLSPVPNLTSNQLCLLRLSCIGQGESSILASAEVGTDLTQTIEPSVLDFAKITAITNGTQLSALNRLVLDLKSEGLWDVADVIYPFIGTSAAQHAWNIKNTNTFKITWQGSVTHDANGVTGDGLTGYGDTGFVPSTAEGNYALNSSSFAVYNKTIAPTNFSFGGNPSLMGVVAGARAGVYFGFNSCRLMEINATSFDIIGPFGTGLIGGSRTASSICYLYSAHSTSAPGTEAPVMLPKSSIYLLGQNSSGLANPSNANLAFAWIGGGLTTTQMAALDIIITRYETTLGRQ